MTSVDEKIQQAEDYLTVSEVAIKLRVAETTVRNMCERGDIPGVRRIGRQWRIPASYLTNPA